MTHSGSANVTIETHAHNYAQNCTLSCQSGLGTPCWAVAIVAQAIRDSGEDIGYRANRDAPLIALVQARGLCHAMQLIEGALLETNLSDTTVERILRASAMEAFDAINSEPP